MLKTSLLYYSLNNRTRSCYKFHRVSRIWSQATVTCMSEGGYLAIINDAIEAEVIKEIFAKNPQNSIVGGSFKGVAAVRFLDLGRRNGVTIHGQSLSEVYSNFSKSQPDASPLSKCGGVFRNGRHSDIPCKGYKVPFICEKDPEKAFADCHIYRYDYVYIPKTGGWMKYHRTPDTFPRALLRCIAEGAILASPTKSCMREAMLALNKGESFWIFTGIHAIFSKGDYSTVDGLPLDKIKVAWAPDEPYIFAENEQCTAMHQTNGTLATVQCNKRFPYICFREKTSDHPLEPCGTVDKLYSLDNRTRSCYKFHRVGLTWRQAYMTCMAEGGYLAIINDAIEAKVIKEIFAKNPTNTIVGEPLKNVAAVGFLDMADRNWVTVHGQSLSEVYSNFDKNQPDQDAQKCGAVLRNGLLDNVSCTGGTMPFICEKHPDSLKHAGAFYH